MKLIQNTSPTAVTTLQEAKDSLRILSNREDDYITGLIEDAEDLISTRSGLTLATTTFTWTMYNVCGYIAFPKWPVNSVSDVTSVKVRKEYTSDQVTLDTTKYYIQDSYLVLVDAEVYFEVEVIFNAGYADAASRPKALRRAILLTIGTWYANRQNDIQGQGAGSELPLGVDNIIGPISHKNMY